MLKKQVNIRLEENLINDVTPILSSFGLNIPDACRIYHFYTFCHFCVSESLK